MKWPTVSLREGPGRNFKTLAEIKKGTTLAVLEDKGQWIRVNLEDGRDGWIGKATTSETPINSDSFSEKGLGLGVKIDI